MPLLPDDLSGLPKVSWDQKDIAIVLDPSMIPPEHDNNYPIIGGIAVSRISFDPIVFNFSENSNYWWENWWVIRQNFAG